MTEAKLARPFLLLLLAGAFLLTFYIYRPFLAALALGAVCAVTVYPLYQFMLRSFKGSATLAALVTVLISVICILLPVGLLGSRILAEAGQLYGSLTTEGGRESLGALVKSLENFLSQYVPVSGFAETATADIDTYLRGALSWLLAHLGGAFSSVATLLLNFLIFFIALFFFLRDGAHFKNKAIEISPMSDSDDSRVFRRLGEAVNSVVRGSLTIALIQGFLTAIGFTIFGVPNAVLWGSVAMVAALIPGLGTALVIIPGVIFLFFDGNSAGAIGLLAWGAVAVGLVDNFLGPKLVGKGMKLHPLFVLLAVLGGIIFFGPVGLFLGPITLSLLFTLVRIYMDAVRREHAGSAA